MQPAGISRQLCRALTCEKAERLAIHLETRSENEIEAVGEVIRNDVKQEVNAEVNDTTDVTNKAQFSVICNT